MRKAAVERRLFESSARLAKVREDLEVLDEQLEIFEDLASEAQVDSVVRDAPKPFAEALRHVDAMRSARGMLREEIVKIEAKQERLIARLTDSL